MLCIDTNVVISVLNGREPRLVERFRKDVVAGAIAVSSIVVFELQYGAARSERFAENERRLNLFLSLPITVWAFEREDAKEAGEIRADLKRGGTPIGPYDVLIAGQARRRGATLVTANTREFSRVPGLVLDDWSLGNS